MGTWTLKIAAVALSLAACGCVAWKSDIDSLDERVTGVYRDVGQLQKNRDSGLGDLKKEVEELRARLEDANAAIAVQAKKTAAGNGAGASPDSDRLPMLEARLTRLADDLLALRKAGAAGKSAGAPPSPRQARQALVDIRRSELARLRRRRQALTEEITAMERDVVVTERTMASTDAPGENAPPKADAPKPGVAASPPTTPPGEISPRAGETPTENPDATATPTTAAEDTPLFDRDLEALRAGIRKGPGSAELNRALGKEPAPAEAPAVSPAPAAPAERPAKPVGDTPAAATGKANPGAAAGKAQPELSESERVDRAFDLRWTADFKRIATYQASAGNVTEVLSRIVGTTPATAKSGAGYKAAVVLDFARPVRMIRADNGKPVNAKSVRIEYHWEGARWRLASISDSRTTIPLAGTIGTLAGN